MADELHRLLREVEKTLGDKIDNVRTYSGTGIETIAKDMHLLALQYRSLQAEITTIKSLQQQMQEERLERKKLQQDVQKLKDWQLTVDSKSRIIDSNNDKKSDFRNQILSGVLIGIIIALITGAFTTYLQFDHNINKQEVAPPQTQQTSLYKHKEEITTDGSRLD
jgi:hypothetical protein